MLSSEKNVKNHEYLVFLSKIFNELLLLASYSGCYRLNSTNVYYLVLKESKTWSPVPRTLKVELKTFFCSKNVENGVLKNSGWKSPKSRSKYMKIHEIKSYGTDKNRPWEPRVILGANGRPLNSSRFRNLKSLKIDKVVSEKEERKKEKERGKETRNHWGHINS